MALTERKVRTLGKGVHMDQHGLKLRVSKRSRYFIWSGTIWGTGRKVTLGVGRYGYEIESLQQAREIAFEFRKRARRGIDPRTETERAQTPTVEKAFDEVVKLNRPTWKEGARTEQAWRSSFDTHVMPRLGNRAVNTLTTDDLLACLVPLWSTKPAAARTVLNRFRAVMEWAIAKGYRKDNPALAVRGVLPKNGGSRQHHRALPFSAVPGALVKIRDSAAPNGIKLALEFLILTSARVSEVLGATWDEIDTDTRTWTVPVERMKSGRSHRVPLSREAWRVLNTALFHCGRDGLIFRAARKGGEIQDALPRRLLRKLEIPCVPHGFRSSFRDWAAEHGVDEHLAETCQARVVPGVQKAYLRTDRLDERRKVMNRWAAFVNGQSAAL